ncbi:alpha-isopropylmalate synthase regulatory domain-containing protein [Beggiatoa leptomitoformis]|nr:alpha-isopropylmalate synthase regulatory domain-containing protein [Beggiatoa leptomitoformis]
MNTQEKRTVEIMDTTLRDGEQMQNVSYTPEEKLTISKMLLTEVKVDRLEIASAKASEGERKSVIQVVNWAKSVNLVDRLEILSFVDGTTSIDWAKAVGIQRINLLTKGSYKHCNEQLRKTPEQHIADIRKTIDYALEKEVAVNVYLEDFSNGIKTSPAYVYQLIEALLQLPVKRILLPDTLGILNPFATYEYISDITKRYPNAHFDFHPHDDYGLGTANALAAVKAGIHGIHATINGMGERAGNAALDEVAVALSDFLDVRLNIDEKMLYKASQYVEMFSGQRMANNKPIYGKNVFTQTAGIHADGDKKGNLYANPLIPERFNRKRDYALGKLSGRANLEMALQALDIELTDDEKKVLLQKIVEIGDRKEVITKEDLPYLIGDIFGTTGELPFKLLHCSVNSTYGFKSLAVVRCAYQGQMQEGYAKGDGGYDAFMNAMKDILTAFDLPVPQLIDYIVTIPPGGRTDALVQTIITWQVQRGGDTKMLTTRGVDSDQIMAAIEATVKMVNLIIQHYERGTNSILLTSANTTLSAVV